MLGVIRVGIKMKQFTIEQIKILKTEKRNVRKYTAMAICELIDDIEMDCKNTSMKEWKMFKRIRNTIREKFI